MFGTREVMAVEKEFEFTDNCPFHIKIPDTEGH